MKRTTLILCAVVGAVLGFLAGAAVAVTGNTPGITLQALQMNADAIAGGGMFAGLLVNKDNLSSLFISLKTTFNNAFGSADSNWEKYAMKVTSTTKQNDYAWLSKFPRMRKWIGDKVVKALEGAKYTITNEDFEATVAVDRNDIEDDTLGIYTPMAQSAGESSKQLPDEIMSAVVDAGFTTKCFDGQFFFDIDHPVRGANGVEASVSNKGTKKLSVASLQAVLDSVGAAEVAMMQFKDDEGRPLGVKPNILMVPPALKAIANILVTTDRLEDGKPNPYKGAFEIVVNLRLTSATAWYLLDTTKAIKPFIYQERKAPVFVSQFDMNNPDVFSRKEFKFGAEARAAGGYGFWQLAYGSDGSVA